MPRAALFESTSAFLRLRTEQDDVLSRAQLSGLGADRHLISRRERSGTWRTIGPHVVVLHGGPLSRPTRQRIVERRGGRYYLDAEFDPFDVTVEINGAQHLDQILRDADDERRSQLSAGGRLVVDITCALSSALPDGPSVDGGAAGR